MEYFVSNGGLHALLAVTQQNNMPEVIGVPTDSQASDSRMLDYREAYLGYAHNISDYVCSVLDGGGLIRVWQR
jgi:hypothetical protein